ncbi:Uncharacterised protein [Bordetella pertussis]|nr:Uncharacterised protein [Bordetella pertussis]
MTARPSRAQWALRSAATRSAPPPCREWMKISTRKGRSAGPDIQRFSLSSSPPSAPGAGRRATTV